MRKTLLIVAVVFLIPVSVYFIFNYRILPKNPYKNYVKQQINYKDSSSLIKILVFFPNFRTGSMTNRAVWIPRVIDSNEKAVLIVAEYLKASDMTDSVIDYAIYSHKNRMLYINFFDLPSKSDGGAIAEYLFLYGLFRTINYNMPFVYSVQFLVKGSYSETLMGHISILDPIVIERFLSDGAENEIR